MTCREARDALAETLTGRTPPELRRRVLAHLERCEECRVEAAAQEETVAMLRADPDPDPPAGFWPEFMLRLEERLAAEPVPFWTRLRRRAAVPALGPAAATVIVVAIIALSALLRPAWGPDRDASNPLAPYMTEAMRTLLPSIDETVQIWRSGLGSPDLDHFYEIVPAP